MGVTISFIVVLGFVSLILILIEIKIAIHYFSFRKYLKTNYYERWAHITSGPGFGPEGQNSFRALGYLYNEEDTEDQLMENFKKKVRAHLPVFIILYFSIPLTIFFNVALVRYYLWGIF